MTGVVAVGHRPLRGHPRATTSRARPAPRRSSTRSPSAIRATPGVLSFVGFAPAEEPRLVMLVMLDEPKQREVGQRGGGPDLQRRSAARCSAISTCRRAAFSRWRSSPGRPPSPAPRRGAAREHRGGARAGRRRGACRPARQDAASRAGHAGPSVSTCKLAGRGRRRAPGAAPGRSARARRRRPACG